MIYAEGNKYNGEWKDGERSGNGKFISSTGFEYEGEWLNDKKHGIGVYI
jgi:hypothetical protein